MDAIQDEDKAPDLILEDDAGFLPNVTRSSVIPAALPNVPLSTSDDNTSISTNNKVPVTIITGFLGSGKTTLIQNILTAKHDYKIAVILNEFGDSAGIESNTIPNDQAITLSTLQPLKSQSSDNPTAQSVIKSNTEWLELANGCLCCTVKDAGVSAIENLMALENTIFDYILLESTGLADPAPIASMFWLDEALNSLIYLDGIVTVVDAKYGYNYIMNEGSVKHTGGMNEATRQIALGDRVIINKVDLVNEKDVDRLVEVVQGINRLAPIKKTIRSSVDLDFILGLNAFDGRQFPEELACDETNRDHDNHQQATDAVTTVSFTYITPIPKSALEKFLQRILWDKTTSIHSTGTDGNIEVLRAKAVVNLVESPSQRIIVQAVRELYDLNDGGAWDVNSQEEKKSKIVVIGRGIDLNQLITLFEHFVQQT